VGGNLLVGTGEWGGLGSWSLCPLNPVLLRSGAGGRRSENGAVSGSPVNRAERWAENFAAPLTCSGRNIFKLIFVYFKGSATM